jgi:hypothetical protein
MTTTAPAFQTGNDDRSLVFLMEKSRFLAQSGFRRTEVMISSPAMKGNDECGSRFDQKGIYEGQDVGIVTSIVVL